MKTYVVMEHPVDMDGVYPDEYVEFWAGVYLANPEIRAAGVLFGTFLRYPVEIIRAVCFAPLSARDPRLLRAQRELQRRIDLENAGQQLPLPIEHAILALEHQGARVSDGAWVEKLKHTTWPRRAQRRVPIEV